MDEEILAGKRLASFQGDVPDWFYILQSEPELWPWFCLEGVTPRELREYAKSVGVELPEPEEDDIALAAKVMPMGSCGRPSSLTRRSPTS